jgi:hypothetical protein
MISFTKIKNKRGHMVKRFSLSEDGKLVKNGDTNLYLGSAKVIQVYNLSEFSDVLDTLESDECVCFGVPNT